MSDEKDKDQQTEEPSQRKLQQAREKGQVTLSRDVVNWAMFLAIGTIVALAPPLSAQLGRRLAAIIEQAHVVNLERLAASLVGEVAILLLPLLGICVIAAVAATLLQTGPLASLQKLKPKLSNVSPLSGWKRLVSMRALGEFGKGILKTVLVGVAVAWVMLPTVDELELLPGRRTEEILAMLHGLLLRIVFTGAAVMTAVALLDYLHQRFQFLKSMRMSKQEVKEEYKQTEGDPHVKGRIRQIRAERARRRMMAAVPDASVVITNPTHFAVALHYEIDQSNAPKVVAKGADVIAAKIREVATANGVPIVENPPLARLLYAAVDLDEEIPPEHYKAVAEVIGFVLRQQGKLKPRQAARPM
jgi:flagellar biosynthetic protein FlhB